MTRSFDMLNPELRKRLILLTVDPTRPLLLFNFRLFSFRLVRHGATVVPDFGDMIVAHVIFRSKVHVA